MEINPNLKPATLTAITTPAATRNWTVGQLLNAVALSGSERGQATLRAGSATLTAQVPFPVKPGQTFTLEVISLGKLPLLQVVQPTRIVEPFQTVLRSALPRQGGLPPLLANLAWLSEGGPNRGAPLPAPLLQAVRTLFGLVTKDRDAATPTGLRQAVQNSGLLLEAKLAREANGGERIPTGNDLKAGLLSLRAVLREMLQSATPGRTDTPSRNPATGAANPATQNPVAVTLRTQAPPGSSEPLVPPLGDVKPQPQARIPASLITPETATRATTTLLEQVESSLARIHLSQLASHQAGGDQRMVWLLEIPVRKDDGADVFQLRVERDDDGAAQSPEHEQRWSVELAFDLDGLGPVNAKVTVCGEQVTSTFWTQREQTADLLRRNMQELQRSLDAAGLKAGPLTCHVGSPPPPASPGAGQRLLDEQV